MFSDLKYVQSLEKEVDKLQTDKTELSKEYDLLLQEWFLKDIMCSILYSFKSLDEKTELQYDDVVVLKNSETKEEDVKEDESDHNKERYTFEDGDDDGEFDDLD
ncbi:hypothetical protein Tco_0401688 [Tanacetum coccineum]